MEIIRGKRPTAIKLLLYGVPGVGKTTFAAQFPEPLFIDTEDSTAQMDVARLPKPATWKDLIDEVQWCIDNAEQLRTLVIDTADWADALCQADVIASGGKGIKSIEDFGYGKGYKMVGEKFQKELIAKLDQLKTIGVNIVIVAHAMMRKVDQPEDLASYDRWEPKCSKQVNPLLKEWADNIWFVNYKTDVAKTNDGKVKATGGKKRVIYATHTAAWDAKNRHGLPDELPLEFDAVKHILPQITPEKPAQDERAAQAEAAKNYPVPIAGQKPKVSKTDKIPVERPDSMRSDDKIKDTQLAAVWKLMNDHGITPADLVAVVTSHNFYPADTMPGDYDADFIDQMLLKSWEKLLPKLQSVMNDLPF